MPNTLLLADDSVTIRRVIELTFADENMRVVSVSNGREALARIESAPPDIILADAGMPEVSGYDIAAFVKSRPALRHIPVVLLAGAFEPLDEARARKSGSDGVLVKPFEPQMVVARVRELLSQPRAAAAASIQSIQDPTALPARRTQAEGGTATDGLPDPLFDDSLDRLDAAFNRPGAPSLSLDATAESDFANDLRELRSNKSETPAAFDRGEFGDWDLPARPDTGPSFDALSAREPEAAADVFRAPEPEPVAPPMPSPIALSPKPVAPPPPAAPPAPPAPPAAPVYAAPTYAAPAPAPAPAQTYTPPPAPRPVAPSVVPLSPMPLADAFSNLLAAEEGRPHQPVRGVVAGAVGNQPMTDADMELIVDRVIARLGGGVRGAVIDLAERLVKAEIDRLKAIR